MLVSSITVRNDQHHKKTAEVNIILNELCKEKYIYIYIYIYYINYEKKITVKHLNGSKFHLNRKGQGFYWIRLQNLYLTHCNDALFYVALIKVGVLAV